MTVKDLVKIVEQHNKLTNLLQGDEKVINIGSCFTSFCGSIDITGIKTLKEFNKQVKLFYIDSVVKDIKGCELIQDDKYLNCFSFSINGNDFLY